MLDTSTSLLKRLQNQVDSADWRRFLEIYTPLIQGWLRRDLGLSADAEDSAQEVLRVVVEELPAFVRQRSGSFRRWLRLITVNQLRTHRKKPHHRERGHADFDESVLQQLEDPASELSRRWDEEHDRRVIQGLLEMIKPEFHSDTLHAFTRYYMDEVPAAQVAAELGMSANAVRIANSRVLGRLRQLGQGLME